MPSSKTSLCFLVSSHKNEAGIKQFPFHTWNSVQICNLNLQILQTTYKSVQSVSIQALDFTMNLLSLDIMMLLLFLLNKPIIKTIL